MSSELDTQKLASAIKSKRGSSGLRITAEEIGTSASTLSRVEQGNLPDIETYIRICKWLEVSTDYFTMDIEGSPLKSDEAEDIVVHLRASQTLSPSTASALIEMIQLAYSQASSENKK